MKTGVRGSMLGLVLLLVACQPAPIPTPQSLPTLAVLSSATAVSSPSPTSDIPAIGAVMLDVQVEDGSRILPADTLTGVWVLAQVQAPPEIDVEGLMINFQAFGGGLFENVSVPIVERQARAYYVSGETVSSSAVELRATLDIPQLGRVAGETTIELVRQTLNLQLLTRQTALINGETTIQFELSSEPADIGGQYRLQVTGLVDDQLLLNNQPFGGITTVSVGEPYTLTYHRLVEEESGSQEFCLSLPDRSAQARQCGDVLWGPVGDFLDVRIADTALWAHGTIADMRIGLGNQTGFVSSVASLCYEVLIAPTMADDSPLLVDWETNRAFPPGTCLMFDLSAGYNYVGFQPLHEAWLLRWSLFAPGLTQPQKYEMLVAAQKLRLRTMVDRLNIGSGAWLALPNPNPSLLLYSVQPLDSSSNISGLLKVYIRAADLFNGQLVGTRNSALTIAVVPDMGNLALLYWSEQPPQPLYLGTPVAITGSNNVIEWWYPVYFNVDITANLLESDTID